jgi:hypothetical protein
MRFFKGHARIIDCLRPHPIVGDGGNYYRFARWRSQRGNWQHSHEERNPWKPRKNQTGGWLPGRWRWAGLQPMRRVINPAVRYWPVTRQANEIRATRWKGKEPFSVWDKCKPIRKRAAPKRC